MGNPFAWVEIPVDDMERARRFYEEVFEITLQRMPGTEFEMWGFDSDQTSYGAGGALIHMPGYAAGKPGATVYFACADCADQLDRAVAAGGRVRSSKTSKGTRSDSTRRSDGPGRAQFTTRRSLEQRHPERQIASARPRAPVGARLLGS